MKKSQISSSLILLTSLLLPGIDAFKAWWWSFPDSSTSNYKINETKETYIFYDDLLPSNKVNIYQIEHTNTNKLSNYIDIETAKTICSINGFNIEEQKLHSGTYSWTSYYSIDNEQIKEGSLYFNVNQNCIETNNLFSFANKKNTNYFLDNDIISNTTGTISSSLKSNNIYIGCTKTIYLQRYNYRLLDIEDKLYVPLSLFTTLLQMSGFDEIIYNGIDIYLSNNSSLHNKTNESTINIDDQNIDIKKEEDNYLGNLSSQLHSYDLKFTLNEKLNSNPLLNSTNNSYTDIYFSKYNFDYFSYKVDYKIDETIKNYNAIVLKDNNHDFIFIYDTQDDKINITNSTIIYTKDTYASENYLPENLINENLSSIALRYDYSYPIKSKYSYFEDLLEQDSTLHNRLLSTNPLIYADALYELYIKIIDDNHTAYINSNYLLEENEELKNYLSARHVGVRNSALNSQINYLHNLRSIYSVEQGYEVVGDTVYITFDSFKSPTKKLETNEEISLDYTEYLNSNDTARFLRSCFLNIEQNENINNVVFDLSLNTGGSLNALVDSLGFITRNPHLIITNYLNDSLNNYYYKVDTNLDSEFDDNDSYENEYNFYIIQSNATFSSANEFVTALKDVKNVKSIGYTSAGGSSMLFKFNDMFGSNFSYVSPTTFMYLDEDKNYVNNDQGIYPDYTYSLENIYDRKKVTEYIQSLN